MKKDLLILLAVLIPVAIITLLVASKFSNKKFVNPFANPTPYPTISQVQQNESATISPAASINIEVLSPRGGDSVSSSFAVKGNARVFENVVSIRLIDEGGNILVETTALANAPDVGQFGPFEKMINFNTQETSGTLEVYQSSAKDGSEIDKVIIPLQFK